MRVAFCCAVVCVCGCALTLRLYVVLEPYEDISSAVKLKHIAQIRIRNDENSTVEEEDEEEEAGECITFYT